MLPTLQVFLDDGTGTFPFDISSKVLSDGHEISRGRDDWQSAVTAGQLSLSLNNSDGRFTTGSTILATPSPIKVDQRIRIKETVNGTTYTRFTGYVKSWQVEWPAVVTSFATTQVTATDAQARAERRTLRSMLEEEILLDSPTAYYRLSEPEGSTSAGDISGNQAPPLTIAGTGSTVVFGNGTGPGVDGLTAAQFAGGQYLTANLGNTLLIGFSQEFWFNTAADGTLFTYTGDMANTYTASVSIQSGNVAISINRGVGVPVSSVIATSGTDYRDGHTHHVYVSFGDSAGSIYVDGALAVSTSWAFTSIGYTLGGTQVGNGFTGTLSHVAYDALSSGRVLAHYQAGSGLPESGTARLTRLASYAGLTAGTFDTSLTNVPLSATSGQSAQDAIQQVADAETGLVFIDGAGALTFHNRNRVASKTAPDLTLSSQYLTTDVIPVVDDQRLVNYVEATAAGTGAPSVAHNQASEDAHGRYPESTDYLVTTDQEALDRANWVVGKLAEPTARYGTLTINLYAMTAAQASSVLAALELDCWLRVTSLASQNPDGATSDVIVQGWRETACNKEGSESWSITCNVVARSLFKAALWDDTGSLWNTAVWFY